jgi:hypothetical protein
LEKDRISFFNMLWKGTKKLQRYYKIVNIEKIKMLPIPLARFLPERRPLHTLPGPFVVLLRRLAEPGLKVPYSRVLA